jgi:methionyl-tRNA formyltransferase
VDTGGILAKCDLDIGPDENFWQLAERLSSLGAKVVLATLALIDSGNARPQQQDETRASAAPKIMPADRCLDFRESGVKSINRVRALAPAPAAVALFRENLVKVLALSDAGPVPGSCTPGEVIEANPKVRLVVASSDRALEVSSIQPQGKAPQSGVEFVRGYRVENGERFEVVSPERLHG